MSLRNAAASMFAPLLMHNLNQQQALQRAATAQATGLDPNQYGTVYPGSQVTNTTNNTGRGWLPGALLGATLLAGGGLGALGLGTQLLSPKATPSAPSAPPATSVPAVPSAPSPAWDAIYEQQQPDGTWKQIRREHLNPGGVAP